MARRIFLPLSGQMNATVSFRCELNCHHLQHCHLRFCGCNTPSLKLHLQICQETAAECDGSLAKQCFSLGADGVSIAGSVQPAYWVSRWSYSRIHLLVKRYLAGTRPQVNLIQGRKRELQGEWLNVLREMKNWISASKCQLNLKAKKRIWCGGEKGVGCLSKN